MAKAIDRTAFDILEAERNAVRAAFTTASDAAADFGELEQRASKRGVPVGELVREILERALRQRAGDLLEEPIGSTDPHRHSDRPSSRRSEEHTSELQSPCNL